MLNCDKIATDKITIALEIRYQIPKSGPLLLLFLSPRSSSSTIRTMVVGNRYHSSESKMIRKECADNCGATTYGEDAARTIQHRSWVFDGYWREVHSP
jgi:hypothetical protein